MDLTNKFILDACCGPKHFWLDKNHKNTLYIDIRKEDKGFMKTRYNRCVQPNAVLDFRNLPFKDNSFKLIVWDPPHMVTDKGLTSFVKTYGSLKPETWQSDLTRGFNELWRVLDNYGVMVFKWCESNKKTREVLALFHTKPLFGNGISKHNTKTSTYWYTFMKIPEQTSRSVCILCDKEVSFKGFCSRKCHDEYYYE